MRENRRIIAFYLVVLSRSPEDKEKIFRTFVADEEFSPVLPSIFIGSRFGVLSGSYRINPCAASALRGAYVLRQKRAASGRKT